MHSLPPVFERLFVAALLCIPCTILATLLLAGVGLVWDVEVATLKAVVVALPPFVLLYAFVYSAVESIHGSLGELAPQLTERGKRRQAVLGVRLSLLAFVVLAPLGLALYCLVHRSSAVPPMSAGGTTVASMAVVMALLVPYVVAVWLERRVVRVDEARVEDTTRHG